MTPPFCNFHATQTRQEHATKPWIAGDLVRPRAITRGAARLHATTAHLVADRAHAD
jgi:hypothetical protein